jgi:hypothetical protein
MTNLENIIKTYKDAFNKKCQEIDIINLRRLYWSKIEEPSVLPKKPPLGWLWFNEEIGGLPWHGYDG